MFSFSMKEKNTSMEQYYLYLLYNMLSFIFTGQKVKDHQINNSLHVIYWKTKHTFSYDISLYIQSLKINH